MSMNEAKPEDSEIKLTMDNEAFLQLQNVINQSTRRSVKSKAIFEELKMAGCDVRPCTVKVNYSSARKIDEYEPLKGFLQQMQKLNGETIEPNDFFLSSLRGERVRSIVLVGEAGYGKTEMLRRFADDVLEKKIPTLEEVEIVHHMTFRDVNTSSRLNLGELLFGHTELDAKYYDACMDWIADNSEKFLLVMDGADEYCEELGQIMRTIKNPTKKDNATAILDNLLKGSLLPDIRILYSSREDAIREFDTEFEADRIVALTGFSPDSVEKLVRRLAADEANWVWGHLVNKSPALLSLCSNPMLLHFTLLALLRNKSNPPETLSEMLLLVIGYFFTSDHAPSDTILKVIHDFKVMSFKMTIENKVKFTHDDVPSSYHELKDLLVPLPGDKWHNHEVLQGKFEFIFCHQSLQEAFTALFVAEMPLDDFKQLVSMILEMPEWVAIRRLVHGFLLNPSAYRRGGNQGNGVIGDIPDRDEKGKFLKLILTDQIKIWFSSSSDEENIEEHSRWIDREELELIQILQECGETANELLAHINCIRLQDVTSFSSSDLQCLKFILDRCPVLEKLSIRSFSRLYRTLSVVVPIVRKSDIEVKNMEIGDYLSTSHDGMQDVVKLLPRITDRLWICKTYLEEAHFLQNKLNEMPPTKLQIHIAKVYRYPQNYPSCIESLGSIILSQKQPKRGKTRQNPRFKIKL